MDETLALLPKPASAGGMSYRTDVFSLATLQAAGAVSNATFMGGNLPAKARVMAMEFALDTVFTGTNLAGANGYVYVVSANDPVRHNAPSAVTDASFFTPVVAGSVYCQALGYVNGTNVFATQGGNPVALAVGLTGLIGGALFSQLTAGHITVRTYYTILA
jgi:hypothetical protein